MAAVGRWYRGGPRGNEIRIVSKPDGSQNIKNNICDHVEQANVQNMSQPTSNMLTFKDE